MSRDVLRIVLLVVTATLVTYVLAGLYFWLVQGEVPADAFLDEAVQRGLIFIDIGIVTWLGLLIVGTIRKLGIGWGFVGSLLGALVGIVVNLVWIFILSAINGGADLLAIALGMQGALFFLMGVVLAELLARKLIPRNT